MLKHHSEVLSNFIDVCFLIGNLFLLYPDLSGGRFLQQIHAAQKVDFPEPDGPMMATTSPALISVDIPFSTSFSPKDLCKLSILITASHSPFNELANKC